MDLDLLAQQVGELLHKHSLMLATAESCTGGWAAKVITDIAGSSAWFDRGFITYANQAKQDMLGVRAETLAAHGAVSEATVREMSEGALARSRAQVSLAVSGIAGPGGATLYKPVGLVYFAWSRVGQPTVTASELFTGDRDGIRQQAVVRALRGVLDVVQRAL
ncbi:MAG: nicotinamide-nucleotide amidohydrolase family protein [Gammaproteobacteria bacterium]|nr:nicotinamide-nucleotide amidohydrolase family protein [Gammaproteobacteria bacterium]